MSIKVTGAEWNRFHGDDAAWPEGSWYDDVEMLIDGIALDDGADLSSLPEESQITLNGGFVVMSEGYRDRKSLEAHFKAWRKKQTTVFFTCSAPREMSEAIKAAILAAGGKVHGL